MKNEWELSRKRGEKLLIHRECQVKEPRGVRSVAPLKASVGKVQVQGSQGSQGCEAERVRRSQTMHEAETHI